MKKLSGVLAIIILAARLLAQSNEPVRLALIAETDEASAASDVLTAQLALPLIFDLEHGQPPLKNLGEKFEQAPWLTGSPWMYFAGDTPYIGQPNTPGIWPISLSEIETAFAGQKQIIPGRKTQEVQTKEQIHKDLLAKYDHNHNGVIDPDEKEAALDDPAFIESELDVIDTNHDGRLDAGELAYFDANKNKILDPKEQAGIDIVQHLLAERFFKKADVNGDGWLDRQEFDGLGQFGKETGNRPTRGPSSLFPDENHDGHVDLGEWETFLKQQTRSGLRLRGISTAARSSQVRTDADGTIDRRSLFKAAVEFYWQNPGVTNGTQGGQPHEAKP